MQHQLTDRAVAAPRTGGTALVAQLRDAGFPVTYVDRAYFEDGYVLPYAHYHHKASAPGLAAYVDLSAIARGEDGAGQATTVDRSNYRSLHRDYPGAWTPISFTNVDVLGAFAADLTPDLVTALIALKDEHPVYDEGDLTELESDEITETWDQYVRSEIASELCAVDAVGDAWDALTGDEQRDLFWSACDALDIYPEHDGRDVRWTAHYPAIVTEVSRRLA
jgi:hypothetical protein